MGGVSQTNRQLLKSADGLNWFNTNVAYFTEPGASCNGIAWNNYVWVVSGKNTSSTFFLYSGDANNWTQISNTIGGGPVEWNGSYFLCAGVTNTSILYKSNDGANWTTQTIGSYGRIQGIAWNETMWVITTDSTSVEGIYISYDGIAWTAVGGVKAYAHLGVKWNGVSFIANTSSNLVRTSYDGVTWTDVSLAVATGYQVDWVRPHIGNMNIQAPTIVCGKGTYCTMAYSEDGIYYRNLGSSIFTDTCYHAKWNGSIWVAGGKGTNTLAYSYDGLVWTGLGNTTFTSACYEIAWNNSVWVACGEGGNTIATSTDGKTWTGKGASVIDGSGLGVEWNGSIWLVGGRGSGNTLAVSTTANAASFSGIGNTVLTTETRTITWAVDKWIIGGVGTNTMAYTTDPNGLTSWTAISNPLNNSINSIQWNGSVLIAGGSGSSHTIATSTDGLTWTGRGNTTFTTACNSVYWNTKRWVAGGSGGNTVAYSYNGTTWYSAINTNTMLSQGVGVASNNKMGASVVNSSLYLKTNNKMVVNSPAYYEDAIQPDTAINIQLNLPK
ncbi:hypothetical protein EBX93_14635 [bacterium]|nr:hypothetical protein [bacterium]